MTVGLKQLPCDVSACCEVRQAAGNKPVRSAILDTYELHESDHNSILHQLHLRVRACVPRSRMNVTSNGYVGRDNIPERQHMGFHHKGKLSYRFKSCNCTCMPWVTLFLSGIDHKYTSTVSIIIPRAVLSLTSLSVSTGAVQEWGTSSTAANGTAPRNVQHQGRSRSSCQTTQHKFSPPFFISC